MDPVPTSARLSLGLAVVVVCLGLLVLEPLPPTVTWLYGLPPLVLGIGVWIVATFAPEFGVYGLVAGRLPPLGHAAVRFVSGLITAGAVLWFLKQPGANAAPLERRLQALETRCEASGKRVERGLMELLEAVEAGLATQTPVGRAASERRIRSVLERCVPHLEKAFAEPKGTHRSWIQLRDWLVEHPHGLGQDASFWRASPPPQTHPHTRRPVAIDL